MLWNRDDLGMTLRYEASAKGARAIGVEVEASASVRLTTSMRPSR